VYRAGYCLVNLRSAVEFILYMDASVVAMDPEVFNKKVSRGLCARVPFVSHNRMRTAC
jgi:hypothetical protein